MIFMQTYTGKKVYLQNPSVDDIDIEDIAHGLAHTCRFAGQCSEYYSVAEHSVNVAVAIQNRDIEFEALMHDATEAYIHDITSPLKSILPEYKRIEIRLNEVIMQKFNLSSQYREEIKDVDLRMLATERDAVFKNRVLWGKYMDKIKPYENMSFKFYSPKKAKAKFLKVFYRLQETRNNET